MEMLIAFVIARVLAGLAGVLATMQKKFGRLYWLVAALSTLAEMVALVMNPVMYIVCNMLLLTGLVLWLSQNKWLKWFVTPMRTVVAPLQLTYGG